MRTPKSAMRAFDKDGDCLYVPVEQMDVLSKYMHLLRVFGKDVAPLLAAFVFWRDGKSR